MDRLMQLSLVVPLLKCEAIGRGSLSGRLPLVMLRISSRQQNRTVPQQLNKFQSRKKKMSFLPSNFIHSNSIVFQSRDYSARPVLYL